MASRVSHTVLLSFFFFFFFPAWAQLNPNYYDHVCPQALPAIQRIVYQTVAGEPRMGASLIRLHFHDCFANGCDGSVLLDDTPTFTGEKTAKPNNNSLRGFDVIDRIKTAVNAACFGNVVSCADIVAVAARDSVVALGGSSYAVQLGRRDSTTASRDVATNNIPSPSSNMSTLLSRFQRQGLSLKDLVVLSGAHTVGMAQCRFFRNRVYNETTTIDASFAAAARQGCPSSGGDRNLSPLDASTARFDGLYFQGLQQKRGLLHSDQELFKGDGGEADQRVRYYGENPDAFWEDFAVSILRMGNITPLTGAQGQIRANCRKVNSS